MSASSANGSKLLRLPAIEGRGKVSDVVVQLASAIGRAELRVGDRLPVEREIAEQLGVSRTTVRKGLGRLRQSGMVESRSGHGRRSGTFVVSEVVPLELLGVPEAIGFDEISDALQARRVMETNVVLLASEVATEEDLKRLREILHEQIAAGSDVIRVRQLDPSFHLAIARATHNDVIVALMQTLLKRLELSRNPPVTAPDEAHSTVEIHQATIDAIVSRDPVRIAQTVRCHLTILERTWESTTGRKMPPWPQRPLLAETALDQGER